MSITILCPLVETNEVNTTCIKCSKISFLLTGPLLQRPSLARAVFQVRQVQPLSGGESLRSQGWFVAVHRVLRQWLLLQVHHLQEDHHARFTLMDTDHMAITTPSIYLEGNMWKTERSCPLQKHLNNIKTPLEHLEGAFRQHGKTDAPCQMHYVQTSTTFGFGQPQLYIIQYIHKISSHINSTVFDASFIFMSEQPRNFD